MSKPTLITGAGGFIGSHLVERLVRDGSSIRAFVHYNSRGDIGSLKEIPRDVLSSVEIVQGDVRDPFSVEKAVAGCDVVFHLASLIAIPYSYVAPQSYVSTNVLGAVNVLQAALRHNVRRVVHTSTSECYGTAQYVPIDEAHPFQGQSPYSASKIGADMITDSYWHSFGLPVSTIRPFNTYGPRQSERAVVPTIITQALTKKEIQLGALTPTRDLNFVTDTVDGFVRVAESEDATGKTINIGTGREISVGDLAKMILGLMNSKARVISNADRTRPENSEVEQLCCDNTKARRVLGWAPTISLNDGLQRTIDWITENLDRYNPDIYNV